MLLSVLLALEEQRLNALTVQTYREQFTTSTTDQILAIVHVQREHTFPAQSLFTVNPAVSCVSVAKGQLIIAHLATAARISISLTTHVLHSVLTTIMLTLYLASACSALQAAKVASGLDYNLALVAKLLQTLHNTIFSSIPLNVCFIATQASTAPITNAIYVTQLAQRVPHTPAAQHVKVSTVKPFSSVAPTVWLSAPRTSMEISVAILASVVLVVAVHAMAAPSKNAFPAELTQTVIKIT